MQWCAYAAYVRYGFEGTMLSIYSYDREPLECSVPYCHFKHPHKFLEELNLQDGVFWVDVVVLIGFFLFFRILGYFVLKFKVKSDAQTNIFHSLKLLIPIAFISLLLILFIYIIYIIRHII